MTFANGPAHKKHLLLKRAPLFLRIVFDAAGKMDGLDQLEDTPAAGETISVYHRVGEVTHCFLDGEKCTGCFAMADYEYFEPQPDEATMRSTDSWREWCATQLV